MKLNIVFMRRHK